VDTFEGSSLLLRVVVMSGIKGERNHFIFYDEMADVDDDLLDRISDRFAVGATTPYTPSRFDTRKEEAID